MSTTTTKTNGSNGNGTANGHTNGANGHVLAKIPAPFQLVEQIQNSEGRAFALKRHAAALEKLGQAEGALRAAKLAAEKSSAAIQETTSATPDDELTRLISADMLAITRVRHAEDDVQRAKAEASAREKDVHAAENTARKDLMRKLAIDPIVAMHARITALESEARALRSQQEQLFRQVVRPLSPPFERSGPRWMQPTPDGVYEDVADVLQNHANVARPPDPTDPTHYENWHDQQSFQKAMATAWPTPKEDVATLSEFTENDIDHLVFCLDTLGGSFAAVGHIKSGNLPLWQWFEDVAGINVRDRSGKGPMVGLSEPRAQITGRLLAEVLHAVRDGGPAFEQACAKRAFDPAAARRRRTNWIPSSSSK